MEIFIFVLFAYLISQAQTRLTIVIMEEEEEEKRRSSSFLISCRFHCLVSLSSFLQQIEANKTLQIANYYYDIRYNMHCASWSERDFRAKNKSGSSEYILNNVLTLNLICLIYNGLWKL